MKFLKFQTKQGKKYNILPIHVRGFESEGDGTRVWLSIAGSLKSFVANKPHTEVETMIENALAEESEQSA